MHGAFEHGDFIEGVRALIVEKDNAAALESAAPLRVKPASVEKFFGPRWPREPIPWPI